MVSFLLACPNCGPRDVYEFRFGGEFGTRPQAGAPHEAWSRYLYARANEAGVQKEWWYHRSGCHAWFLALRDTRTNLVVDVIRPEVSSR
jgi:heterotetrameric sarcosine oxidase delta subunit